MLPTYMRKYQKPVWVTEFAMIKFGDGGVAQFPDRGTQARFAEESSKALGALEFVERYAWFATPEGSGKDKSATWNLMDGQGAMTEVGRSYMGV